MFERLSRSWTLVKASGAVLKADKELLLFPVLSGLSCLLVAASFALPMLDGDLRQLLSDAEAPTPWLYALGFLFYLSQYCVITYFNSALVGAALIRLRGGDPTLGDGLRIANRHLPAIFGYALIAATVGLLLRSLQERVGFIGRFVVGLLGLAWTVATFLAVPALVARGLGPVAAVKHSAALLKKTWGENLAGNAGMGLAFVLLNILVVLVGAALIVLAASSPWPETALLAIASLVLALVLLAIFQAALQGVYAAAVYRYADEGVAANGFDAAVIAGAFRPKDR